MTDTSTAVSLFKIVTVKDEIVVGLTASELAGMARTGEEGVSTVSRLVAANGPTTLWQYAVRKGADGSLEQAPHQRIGLMSHDTLRVEPYATSFRVVAP